MLQNDVTELFPLWYPVYCRSNFPEPFHISASSLDCSGSRFKLIEVLNSIYYLGAISKLKRYGRLCGSKMGRCEFKSAWMTIRRDVVSWHSVKPFQIGIKNKKNKMHEMVRRAVLCFFFFFRCVSAISSRSSLNVVRGWMTRISSDLEWKFFFSRLENNPKYTLRPDMKRTCKKKNKKENAFNVHIYSNPAGRKAVINTTTLLLERLRLPSP